MDQENQNTENMDMGHENPTMPQTDEALAPHQEMMAPPVEKKSNFGPIIGIIIVVILLILAGFYFWGGSLNEKEPSSLLEGAETEMMEKNENVMEEQASTEVGTPLSDSDEIADIEAELNATDLSDLDAELSDIDSELNF